jgi:hypothetical protein
MGMILDSAAFDADYISTQVAKSLDNFPFTHISTLTSVCTGFNDIRTINNYINLNIKVINELQQTLLLNIKLEALVAPPDIDLIIGRNTIKRYNLLLRHFPGYVSQEVSECPLIKCGCDEGEITSTGGKADITAIYHAHRRSE